MSTPRSSKHLIPPDPEGMNENRANRARIALLAFMAETRQTDESEALGDLIVDLLHLNDRSPTPFVAPLAKAAGVYKEEIGQ